MGAEFFQATAGYYPFPFFYDSDKLGITYPSGYPIRFYFSITTATGRKYVIWGPGRKGDTILGLELIRDRNNNGSGGGVPASQKPASFTINPLVKTLRCVLTNLTRGNRCYEVSCLDRVRRDFHISLYLTYFGLLTSSYAIRKVRLCGGSYWRLGYVDEEKSRKVL